MKKNIHTWIAAAVVSACILTACGSGNTRDMVSEALAIDISGGTEVSVYDTHSGNGDGTSCIAYQFSDPAVLEQIEESGRWKALPFDETAGILVWGKEDKSSGNGPYINDNEGNALVPEIQNGYYILMDRQAEKNTEADADLLERGSFHITLGIYDTDTDTLYFCELDT